MQEEVTSRPNTLLATFDFLAQGQADSGSPEQWVIPVDAGVALALMELNHSHLADIKTSTGGKRPHATSASVTDVLACPTSLSKTM